ncbi:glycoside hydrolase family 3 C-terminal domain-containing protein [soil metagenome]
MHRTRGRAQLSRGAVTTTDPGVPSREASALVERMTLEEKAALASGHTLWTTHPVKRLGVSPVVVADGPHGVRRPAGGNEANGLADAHPATCFPTASALAASWDIDLVEEVGRAVGIEARALGVDVVLGPGANLKRSPLCGRNFEYFSEDPFLSGRMAAAHITGVQSAGAGTSLKHFVANNQEHRRMTIDAVIDERTLRELYLAGFEHAVKATQPWTMMCAYNRVNGTYLSDHHRLLSDVLRDEWGFTGLVVTDWGAMNDRIAAIEAGCDLEMPGPVQGAPQRLVEAVANGDLDVAALDTVAGRVTALALRAATARGSEVEADLDAHHLLARRAAGQVAVLLQNDGEVLPIDREGDTTVALLGGLAETPRFQGTGSSRINPTQVEDLKNELSVLLDPDRVRFAAGYDDPDVIDDPLIAAAVDAARQADVAVIVVGLPDGYENEGNDRTHLALPPAHNALVAAVSAVHDRVVVVLVNGAPVEMPWVEDVQAILEGYLGGQAAGGGLADVLTGVIAPGGRLAETFPWGLNDVPSTNHFPGGPATVEYREGLYVGYRFFETADVPVLFPFGHGLGYGPVSWGEVSTDETAMTDTDLQAGATVTVRVDVTNDGDRPTTEVVQVYVRDVEAAVYRPDRELKGFTKVTLDPGQTVPVEVTLDRRAFAWWDTESAGWLVETGTFEVLVGASSRDIRGQASIDISGTDVALRPVAKVYADPPTWLHVDRDSFQALLGRRIPPNLPTERPFDLNTPLGAIATVPQGKVLLAGIERRVRAAFGDDPATQPLIQSMLQEAPIRSLAMHGLSLDQTDTVLALLNGDWGTGARKLYSRLMSALAPGDSR